MQLFEKKSFSRIAGFAMIITYCLCALWMVAHGKPMPDIPPIASGTILLLYGINKTSKRLNGQT
jgi:hypothetical protein